MANFCIGNAESSSYATRESAILSLTCNGLNFLLKDFLKHIKQLVIVHDKYLQSKYSCHILQYCSVFILFRARKTFEIFRK
jgi:hypothetical protein